MRGRTGQGGAGRRAPCTEPTPEPSPQRRAACRRAPKACRCLSRRAQGSEGRAAAASPSPRLPDTCRGRRPAARVPWPRRRARNNSDNIHSCTCISQFSYSNVSIAQTPLIYYELIGKYRMFKNESFSLQRMNKGTKECTRRRPRLASPGRGEGREANKAGQRPPPPHTRRAAAPLRHRRPPPALRHPLRAPGAAYLSHTALEYPRVHHSYSEVVES